MSKSRVIAHYLLETACPVERAIEVIAGEQSSGTFVSVPGETPELRLRYGARVEHIELLETTDTPSLIGGALPKEAKPPYSYQRARFTLSFPFENMGANIPTLISTVCGNLYELQDHTGLKLLDLELPEEFQVYPGPQFGVEGTRRLIGVSDRPLIGTIVKPSVGLSPEQTAELVKELIEAGLDFIKDDELMANPPHSPLKERVKAVMRVILDYEQKTGKKPMYAFNISDDIENMLEHHDAVLEAGGTCIMVSLNSVGYAATSFLRKRSQLLLHGHRNGWGMLTRHPYLGIAFPAYQQLWRAIGVDHLHVNGLQNKFWEPDDSVVHSVQSMQKPLFGGYFAMPVIASGQWAGQVPETWNRMKTTDILYLAGGGIMGHPAGVRAGVLSIQQAWEAAVQGIPLEDYAHDHEELALALVKFGKRSG